MPRNAPFPFCRAWTLTWIARSSSSRVSAPALTWSFLSPPAVEMNLGRLPHQPIDLIAASQEELADLDVGLEAPLARGASPASLDRQRPVFPRLEMLLQGHPGLLGGAASGGV